MKKFLKWTLIIIGILILLFFLALFILNLLFGYKDSDFNIPENFFDTPHQNDGYKDFSLYPLTYKSPSENIPETPKEIGFYDGLSYSKIDVGIKGSIEYTKELDEKTDKDLEELQTFTLNELGDKKFNYLEKYFSEIDNINLLIPSKYLSLDKDNFQKNNISIENIKTFFDFLKNKQVLEESKYNIEGLEKKLNESILAKMFFNLDNGLNFNYQEKSYFTYEEQYNDYIKGLKNKGFNEEEIKKIDELNNMFNKLEIGTYSLKDANIQITKYISGNGIPDDLKDIVENNKEELEKIVDIFNIIDELCYSSKKRGFSEFVEFIDSISLEIKKITQEKEFFVQEANLYGSVTIYTGLIQYYRATSSIAEIYIKEGKYKEGISILIKNQELIDNVTNRIDKVSILFSVLITLQNINLQSFEYLIDNYKIPDEQKNRILKTLKNEIKFGLIENNLKYEYDYGKVFLNELSKDRTQIYELYSVIYTYPKNKLVEIIVDVFKSLSIICYSEKESQVLQKKFYYDIISNKGELGEFYEKIKENKYAFVLKNPYNFVGRLLATDGLSDYYSMQRQKEEEIHTKRQQLIEKIEGGLEEIL